MTMAKVAKKPPVPGNQALATNVWAADRTQRRRVAELTPFARNARTHSAEQVAQLAASIREWGWTVPVLIDEQSNIIAGHGRVLAAQRLGISEVPVVVAAGWSPEQKRAYVIADNNLALNAGWDDDLLRLELLELRDMGADLSLAGFSAVDLDKLLGPRGAVTDPDEVPPTPDKPTSAIGDVWLLGKHRLACGDCTDPAVVSRVLSDAKPHLMVTDPPYGVSYTPAWRARAGVNKNKDKLGTVLNDDRADWREAWAHFAGDVAYVWHAGVFAGVVAESLAACGFALRSQIVWAKERFALSRGDYHWQHEPCWYAVREGATGHWNGDRSQSTRWEINAREDSGFGHGTQKPVECMRRPIENNSKPGEPIYEPFSGSGTTIIAAEMTGRCCHAIELNPSYVDVAVIRWQVFTGQEARLEDTGESFSHLQERRGARAECEA
jgi:DNA modification methylase